MSEKFKDYLAMYCTEDDLSEEKYISQYLKGKEDGKRKLRKLKPYKNCVFLQLDDDSFNLQKYKDKLINVKTKSGLTLDYYNETIEKLKSQGVENEICND